MRRLTKLKKHFREERILDLLLLPIHHDIQRRVRVRYARELVLYEMPSVQHVQRHV
jgi:hypothetical protein